MNEEQRLEELAAFYTEMSDDEIDYIQSRGFEITKKPIDKETINRPYFILSDNETFRLAYSKFSEVGGCIVDTTRCSTESLAGMIEEACIYTKDFGILENSFPNPEGQPFLMVMTNPNWERAILLLQKRYS